jgi:hypothetical protein
MVSLVLADIKSILRPVLPDMKQRSPSHSHIQNSDRPLITTFKTAIAPCLPFKTVIAPCLPFKTVITPLQYNLELRSPFISHSK